MILIRSKSSSPFFRYIASKIRSSAVFSSSHLLTSRRRFTSNVVDSSTATPFVVKYLIDSVGLSSSEAAKAAKLITHIKSPSKPESVLKFFRENGFSDTEIKRIVFKNTRLLCANAESTLKPKFEGLRELGFSEAQIKKLVTTNPSNLSRLSYCNLRPRIELFSGFLCSNDDLIKAFSAHTSILASSIERRIKPNISFLKECQFSNEKIGFLMTRDHKIFCRSLKSLQSIAKRVVDLGFMPGSGMFCAAFRCLCNFNSDKVDAMMKTLGSLGFARAQVLSIILKQPMILSLSEKNLRDTVDFLVNKVGCDLSYICRYPALVCFSLNKRLIPRNYILQLLNEKRLLKNKTSFYGIAITTEKMFLERFIFSFKEKIPKLHDIYLSASAGRMVLLTPKSKGSFF